MYEQINVVNVNSKRPSIKWTRTIKNVYYLSDDNIYNAQHLLFNNSHILFRSRNYTS